MLLYLHIPFCDSKCHYCAFNSYVEKLELKAEYMRALNEQLKFELKRFEAKPNSIETLFIGGGTPSTIEAELYEPIFKTLAPYLSNIKELTSEANPNSATKEWLEQIRSFGINRISFGVQSFNNEKLKKLGRAHRAFDAITAIKKAKQVGFNNLSIDLIYNVLGDSKELLNEDLKQAFSLPINHISAYSLTIEDSTPFHSKPQMHQESVELTKWLFNKIKEHKFEQYEVSNFGTYKSLHNLGYWSLKDYMGVGSGAVGFLKNRRFYPHASIEEYIKKPLTHKTEELSENDLKLERLFLGLRSSAGVPLSLLEGEELKRLELLREEKKVTIKSGRFYNSDYLLSDEIALFLIKT